MSYNFIKILDIKINIISKQEVLEEIKSLLFKPTLVEVKNKNEISAKADMNGVQLVTTNPEFILEAQKNPEFKNIINNSWLSVADGYGIRLASKYISVISNQQSVISKFFTGFKIAWWGISRNNKKLDIIKDIITGTDLVPDICKICEENNKKILFFGSKNSALAKEKLKIKYKNLNSASLILEEEDLINKINNFASDVLLVALNAPFAQIWINNNFKNLPSVKLAIGVGGAFDYISGKIKRAPNKFWGYEWLFRLIKQPKRIKRVFNAIVIFPLAVFLSKINKN